MPEEEAFCVLVQLMSSYKMRDLYKPSMADLSLCFYQLDKLVEVTKKPQALGVKGPLFPGVWEPLYLSCSSSYYKLVEVTKTPQALGGGGGGGGGDYCTL